MTSPRSFPNIDRISNLPDCVICHILSFLPTKQSAATTILSKRWNPLWLSILTLNFDDQHFADFTTFTNSIFSVMLSRNNITLPLLSFSIKCGNYSDFDKHDVERFIDSAVQCGIQKLNIHICLPCYRFKLPPCVLTCSTLTLIMLKSLTIELEFSNVKFPLLKTLHLDRISFPVPEFLYKLLDRCPILEDLQTKNLKMIPSYGVGEFNGLLKLVKANISTRHVPFTLVHNAKFLHAKLVMYSDAYSYQVPTFVNLTHMEIVFEVEQPHQWIGKWKWLAQVLQHCPKLHNLTIHEGYNYGNAICVEGCLDPPTVAKCLSLRTCMLTGYKGMECEFQFARFILKNAELLHIMKISTSPMDINIKYQLLMKLSLCPRGSTTCKLSFD